MKLDIYDAATTIETLEREAAISAQLAASRTPLPYCENCDDAHVHVTAKGVRFRYCGPCAYELTGRSV